MTRLRETIIPIFIPHRGCAHRCVFCDQTAITGISDASLKPEAVRDQILSFLASREGWQPKAQIAFYGGNFLGLKNKEITDLLSVAASFVSTGQAVGIRFSTRPDTIDEKHLSELKPFPVQTVELGVQSMDDEVLARARRGHTARDTIQAMKLLGEKGYRIGMQLMVGLPGDDEGISMETARQVAFLAPDFVRIYPTVVLKNSALARQLERGEYRPWSLERTVALVKEQFLIFKKNKIPVIRMGLQASQQLDKGDHILAGPYHPAFGHLVMSKMMLDNAIFEINGCRRGGDLSTMVLRVHPRSESQLRGMKNENIRRLKKKFGVSSLHIALDQTLATGAVVAECPGRSSQASQTNNGQPLGL